MAVLNKYKDQIPKGSVYIGRGSKWGNRHQIGKHGTRREVIKAHRKEVFQLLRDGLLSWEELAELHGKNLVCFCSPLRCHGHTLEKLARIGFNHTTT